MNILELLKDKSDTTYRDFSSKLMPTVDKNTVIGVRIPELKSMARELSQDSALVNEFMSSLPHKYFEENNLHAFLVAGIKDFDKCIERLEALLPYVDNWATCDSLRPKAFSKDPERLIKHIEGWLSSSHLYTVRFAINMLMVHFLDERFDESYLDTVSKIRTDEYYLNMVIAWYFATALAKQYKSAVKYLEDKRLSPWVHNKTIQKATESLRINSDVKNYLKSLKIK